MAPPVLSISRNHDLWPYAFESVIRDTEKNGNTYDSIERGLTAMWACAFQSDIQREVEDKIVPVVGTLANLSDAFFDSLWIKKYRRLASARI